MKNKLVFLGVLLSFGALFVGNQKAIAGSSVTGHKIVIDAGHGGTDPGSTMCEGKTEAQANLEVAMLLHDQLEDEGATVYMTREDDEALDNRDRYTYANSTDGEVLVSIHFNGSTDRTINYTQGLYAKWKKDIDLASTIHNRLASELGIEGKDLLQFASGVILKAEMPATIQEVSFISHPDECAGLLAGARQKVIAQSLYNGLADWFDDAQVPALPGRGR